MFRLKETLNLDVLGKTIVRAVVWVRTFYSYRFLCHWKYEPLEFIYSSLLSARVVERANDKGSQLYDKSRQRITASFVYINVVSCPLRTEPNRRKLKHSTAKRSEVAKQKSLGNFFVSFAGSFFRLYWFDNCDKERAFTNYWTESNAIWSVFNTINIF